MAIRGVKEEQSAAVRPPARTVFAPEETHTLVDQAEKVLRYPSRAAIHSAIRSSSVP
jgi:hypothetical protein